MSSWKCSNLKKAYRCQVILKSVAISKIRFKYPCNKIILSKVSCAYQRVTNSNWSNCNTGFMLSLIKDSLDVSGKFS